MKERRDSVDLIAPAARDDIDDCARGLTKLSFVSCGQHLKLCNRLLVELRRSTAGKGVLVRLTVDEKTIVAGSFAENGRGIVAADVRLAIHHDAGNELQQVEVVAPVDG